jgi:hypothetical protein
MLDSGLADLYRVPTSRLNDAVKRNSKRFPKDFMFQLTATEANSLTSQIAMSKMDGVDDEHGRMSSPNMVSRCSLQYS